MALGLLWIGILEGFLLDRCVRGLALHSISGPSLVVQELKMDDGDGLITIAFSFTVTLGQFLAQTRR